MPRSKKPRKDVGGGATGSARAAGPEKFVLNNGITLSVQSGDITKMAGDVVVVGEDDDFSGKGAVANALIRAGGDVYRRGRDSLKRQIQKEGREHRVYRCIAGPALQFVDVFHAITLYRGLNKPQWSTHLEDLFQSIGVTAEEILHKNVFTPLLGAGNAGGTVDVSLQAAVNGLSKLTPKSLKEVIIVEYDRNKAAEIRGKLKQILSQDQQRGQGQLQESGRGADGEFPGSPIQPAQGTSAGGQTLLSVARGRGSGNGGDPMHQGAWGGTGRGHRGQGGGRGEGRGAGQPTSHQRTPTSSAQQQSGNHQINYKEGSPVDRPTGRDPRPEQNPDLLNKEKDKREKQTKERDPKRKEASSWKGPKHSAASRGQGAVAQEPDMTGAAITGSMPEGKMVVTEKPGLHLDGYPDCGTILIEYSFPNGTQGDQHPTPGQPYKGTFRRAFMPDNQEGRRVLKLLEKAFKRKLTFHLERSGPNEEWVVEFDDIPHKTSLKGGKKGRGYPDPDYLADVLAVLSEYGLREKPVETSRTDDKQLGSTQSGLPEGETTNEHGGEGKAKENVHSKMNTSSGTIIGTTNMMLTSSNLEGDPSSPPSSSPSDAKKEARKHRRSSKNAALNSLQASGKPRADRSTPETSSTKKSDDSESKGNANAPEKAETHGEALAESTATPSPKTGSEESAISKRGGRKSGQRKKQTHTEAPTEPISTPTPDEGQEESTNPESEDNTNGERNSDTLTKPGTARAVNEDPDASTNPESAINTSGQKNRESDTEPRITSSPAEIQEQSMKPENEDTTNGQDRNTETGPRTAYTSGEHPEKSIKTESEVDTRGHKNEERDVDSATEPKAPSPHQKSSEESTNSDVKVSTNGQRKSKTHSNSQPESRPAPTPAGGRKDQQGTTHSSLPKGDTATGHGGEGGAQQNVHSKMCTCSGTITTTTSTTLTSSNLVADPSSPPSSSPLDPRKEARRERRSSKNAALKNPQASKVEAGKPQADRSIPETSSMKKSDDPESKGIANVPGKAEPHRENPAESSATPRPKTGPEELTIPKRGGTTSGQRKEQTHTDTPTEPSSTPTPDGSQEESINPENKDTTNEQDRDTEIAPRTACTSGEKPEKSIKPESEVDTRRHKNEERDADSTTEAKAPSTPEKSPDGSTDSKVKVGTSGQRKSKTHSDSPPVSRPAPNSAGDRVETTTDAKVTTISDEDNDKSANSEREVDTSGQNNRESDTDTPTEPRAPATPVEIPEASTNPEKEDSAREQKNEELNTPSEPKTSATPAENPKASTNPESEESTVGQKNEALDTSPEPRASATPAESPDASANPESEKSADGQKNEEGDPVTPMEPTAAPSSEKIPEESSNSENVISKGGQRKGETHSDSPPVSRTTLTPDGDPEAASSSKSKDVMSEQSKREMRGTPTDSSSALTPVEDPARLNNPEGVTEEASHSHPVEVEKSEAENEVAEAKLDDSEAEVKNQPEEAKPEVRKPEDKGKKEEEASSKKTGTDSKIFGNIPPGEMKATRRKKLSVPGYDGCGVIVIDYFIPNGEQKAGHPEPGSPYRGCVEYAFLPDNQEGRHVQELLQRAFDSKLTFQLVQTDQGWGVEFADIPHKTSLKGGPERGGYPDPGYLEHVQSVLRDKYGIE